MKKRITKQYIDRLKPSGKRFEVSDSEQRGLILRVSAEGEPVWYLRYRRPDGRSARYCIGDGRSIPPAQARRIAAKKLGEVADGIDPNDAKRKARSATLGEFLDGIYEPWAEKHLKTGPAICKAMRGAFASILPKKLQDVSAWHFQQWRKRKLEEGLSETSINRYQDYLRALFNRAVEWNIIETNPIARVKAFKEDRSRTRFLSPDEKPRLLTALDNRQEEMRRGRDSANQWRAERGYPLLPDLRAAAFTDLLKPCVVLSLHTGLRRSELFGLKWQDVDFMTGTITVRAGTSKTNTTRHIPMNATARDTLAKWHAQSGGKDNDFVFRHADGSPVHDLNTSWRRLLIDAGIDGFRWHDLRHCFASYLVQSGVDLYVVKDLLGHSTIQMTERYAHLSPAHRQAAVAKLDADDYAGASNIVPLERAQEAE